MVHRKQATILDFGTGILAHAKDVVLELLQIPASTKTVVNVARLVFFDHVEEKTKGLVFY